MYPDSYFLDLKFLELRCCYYPFGFPTETLAHTLHMLLLLQLLIVLLLQLLHLEVLAEKI